MTTMVAKRRELMRAAMRGPASELSGPDAVPHWACPDCGEPCYCADPISRAAPHLRCNKPEVIVA